jgi:hypothetical protein
MQVVSVIVKTFYRVVGNLFILICKHHKQETTLQSFTAIGTSNSKYVKALRRYHACFVSLCALKCQSENIAKYFSAAVVTVHSLLQTNR